jgi:hypothetical protein
VIVLVSAVGNRTVHVPSCLFWDGTAFGLPQYDGLAVCSGRLAGGDGRERSRIQVICAEPCHLFQAQLVGAEDLTLDDDVQP